VQILIESFSLGVDPEEVKLSARLVDDLGMD
jgi:acyl carrier protein